MSDQTQPNRAGALAAWRDALGSNGVITGAPCDDHYQPNVSEYRARRIVAALRPCSTAEVEHIVGVARRFSVPLYPVSTGCNWGLGSKLPPQDNCAIVDLSRMDRIAEINPQLGYAIVQPGVTQETLSRALIEKDLPWQLNVTGAGGSTSVVANALERGVGMLGQRHTDLWALEIVFGSGEVMRLGFDHLHYPIGPGPDVSGLFAQSNFGIITAAAVRLHPREDVCLFFAETDAAQFTPFIDNLRRLRQRNLLAHRTEIMADNDPRLLVRLGKRANAGGGWGTWGIIYGDAALRKAFRKALKGGLAQSCRRITFFDQDFLGGQAPPSDVAARFELARGIPSNYSIESMRRSLGLSDADDDLDHDYDVPGMLAVLPAVPLVGERLQRIVDMVRSEGLAVGVQPVISFSTVSDIAAEGFLRVHFDRRDRDSVERAHAWAERVDTRLRRERVPLLRLNLGQMDGFVSAGEVAGKYQRMFGAVFDPEGIIAPGRYASHARQKGRR